MPSIADLFISVTSDVSGALAGLTSVNEKVNGTSSAMTAAAPAGFALAAAAGAVGAGFLSSVTAAADFEKQINGIKAVMSPDEVTDFGVAVRDLALALGKDTVYTAGQAANAIEEMIKAGVPLPAILSGGAKSALDLASATGSNVVDAAGLAATALTTFHLSADKLPGVMDTISNVSNATKTSVSGLAQGLSDVGATAKQFGLSFEDTALAIGVFAQNGLTANTAGTALKTMLVGLTPNTKEQTKVMTDLGLITEEGGNAFFDATGKVKSMSEVAGILQNALKDLTPVQKATTLEILFGRDGMQAAGIAADEGAAGFAKYSAAADKMGGTAVAAAQRNAGLEGSMNQLGGSLEAISESVGKLFLPALTSMANLLTTLANAFLTLDPRVQAGIVAFVGIAGAAAGLLAGFILLGPVISAVGAAFGIIATAAAAVALPIAALVAAGALLYAAWQTNFGGIRDVTQEVWDALQPAFVNIQNFLVQVKDALGPVFVNLGNAIAPLMPILSELVGKWLAQLPPAVKSVGDGFNTLGVWIRFAYDKIQELIATPQAQAFFTGLRAVADALGPPLNAIAGFIGNILGALFQSVDWGRTVLGMLTLGLSDLKPAFDAVITLVQNAFTTISNIANGVGDPWATFVNGAWAIGTRLGEAIGNVLNYIRSAFGGIPNILGGLGDLWSGFINGAWNIGTRIGEAFGNFLGYIGTALGGIPGIISGLGDPWSAFINGAWEIGTRVGQAFGNFLGYIGTALGGIPDIISGLGDLWATFITGAWDIGTHLGEAFGNFLGFIGTALGGIPQAISDLGDLWKPFIDGAWEIGTHLGDAFGNFLGFIRDSITGIPGWITEQGDLWKPFIDGAWAIGTGIGDAFENFLKFIRDAILGIPTWLASIDIFGVIVEQAKALFKGISDAIDPIRALLAATFGNVINWVSGGAVNPGTGTGTTGGTTGGGGTPAPVPGTTGGGTVNGPLVTITGPIYVGTVAEEEAFLQRMADAILAAAQRVTVPPASPFPIG